MPTAQYDRIASWYDEWISTGWDEVERSLLESLMGGIKDKAICDLACGQGRISRELARAGANVVGVDVSDGLLEIAQREEEARPLGITYVNDNAHFLSTLSDGSFDGVLCAWSLLDIEDLSACLSSIARILRRDGWFVFNMTHPCFDAPGPRSEGSGPWQGDYFDEGYWLSDNPNGVRSKVGSYHRKLSTYLNALVDAGLAIDKVVEPQGVPRAFLDTTKMPGFLFVRCKKQGPGPSEPGLRNEG